MHSTHIPALKLRPQLPVGRILAGLSAVGLGVAMGYALLRGKAMELSLAAVGGVGLLTLSCYPFAGLLLLVGNEFLNPQAQLFVSGPVRRLGAILVFVTGVVFGGRLLTKQQRLPTTRLLNHKSLAVSAFALIFFLALFHQPEPGYLVEWGSNIAVRVVLYTLMICLVVSPKHVSAIAWAFMLSGAIAAALSIPTAISLSGVGFTQSGQALQPSRAAAFGGDPNYFAMSLIPPIALMVVGITGPGSWRARALQIPLLILTSLTFILTFSRGGWVGLSVALLILVLRSRQAWTTMAILALIVVILVAASARLTTGIGGPTLLERIQARIAEVQDADSRTNTALFRLTQARVATLVFLDNWLTGIGVDRFASVSRRYTYQVPHATSRAMVAHNAYLGYAAELGVMGLVPFLALLWFTWRDFGQAHGRLQAAGQAELASLTLGFQAGFAGMCVAMLGVTAGVQKELWVLMGLSTALRELGQEAIG